MASSATSRGFMHKFGRRCFSTKSLSSRVRELVPEEQARVKSIVTKYGAEQLGTCSVLQAFQGMRGVKCMVTETSLLDENEGIRFRGYSIEECQKLLPSAPGGTQPVPEGMLWLLLTGEIPTAAEVQQLTTELHSRAKIPDHVYTIIDNFPKTMHPMSQFSSAVLALQTESKFAKAYADGVHKSTYWEHYLEDALDLIARIPPICARIFNNTFRDGVQGAEYNSNLDWSENFCKMIGFNDQGFAELMRMYFTIHTDHEGGNVSAHTTHLVGSALSDCYLSFSAGLNGLAGPLHGLANQEVLRWVKNMQTELKTPNPTPADIEKYCWDTLNSGKVIPGFGHAVLRKTDPRYMCQREFALKNMPEDDLFKLVALMYDVVPGVLTVHGKTKNPWPNVDAHSGVLLMHYGLTEEDYYTVLFGMSRALGVLSNLVIDRYLGMSLERPKSVTSEWIKNHFDSKTTK